MAEAFLWLCCRRMRAFSSRASFSWLRRLSETCFSLKIWSARFMDASTAPSIRDRVVPSRARSSSRLTRSAH